MAKSPFAAAGLDPTVRALPRFPAFRSIVHGALLFLAPLMPFAADPAAAKSQNSDSAPATKRAAAPPRLTGTPLLRVWRADDYGAHPENFSVVQQSTTGFIYVGNGSGVLEFDGARWRLIDVPGGGGANALAVDRHGRIWGVTPTHVFRLEPDARGQLEARSMNDRLPAGFRLQPFLSRCVATAEGVCFCDRQSLIRFGLDDGTAQTWTLTQGSVVVIDLGDIGGEPHVRIGGDTIYRLRQGKPELVPGLHGAVRAARAEADGTWQLLTDTGTQRWDGRILTRTGPLPRGDAALCAVFLADGRSVYATRRTGLVVCDRAGRAVQTIGRAQGLPANQVLWVQEDRQGGVWAAYNNGLARVQLDSPYALHGPAQGVEGTIYSLARQGARLFAGGSEGVAERRADGQFQTVPDVPASVRGVVAHQDWVYILSTHFRGLQPDRDHRPVELENRNYFGLVPLVGQPGWFVQGTNEGVRWSRFENGNWITRGPLEAFRGAATVLLESPTGVAWVAHGGGAQQIDFRGGLRTEAPARRFGAAEGLPGRPTAMFLLGEKIVALARGELERFDENANRFVPETRLTGLDALVGAGAGIGRVHVADDGTIWLQVDPPRAAIARLVPIGGNQWHVERLPGEPLRHLRPTTIFQETATQTLWLAGYGALVSCDLTWQPTHPVTPPAAVLRSIESAAGEVILGGVRAAGPAGPQTLRLRPAQDALRIRFAAPSFLADYTGIMHTEYRTRLDGLDREWSAWSPRTERDLTNLPWRAFTFRVQARDDAGRTGPEATIAFSIAPAWWATRWAWTGYALAGLGAMAGIVRLRTHALHHRAARLEKVVSDRTAELATSNAQLATQNTELARLHRLELDEKIAAQLSEEKARLELLRYQLNPHFLLNAFTTLRSLVYSSPEAAGKTVERLADFCRLALTRSDESTASVDDEVRLIESYLDTEKARWRDELHVDLQIDPAARPLPLPPFLLQPLVENAIKYGGRTSPGTLQLRVCIARTADGLAIEVANTGEWVAADSPHRKGSTGIGLENLHQRLRRQYRDAHEFATEASDGWVFVKLKLKTPGPLHGSIPFAAARSGRN